MGQDAVGRIRRESDAEPLPKFVGTGRRFAERWDAVLGRDLRYEQAWYFLCKLFQVMSSLRSLVLLQAE